MENKHSDRTHSNKRAPRWKILVAIFLIVAMPLFFSFYRDIQLQQALNQSEPDAQQEQINEKPAEKT